MRDIIQPGSPVPGQRRVDVETLFRGRITATSSGATQTLYTAPSTTGISGTKNERAVITDLWMANIDSSAHTFSLYLVDSDTTVDDDRLLFKDVSIDANTLYHVNQVELLIPNGGTIRAYADSANKVVVRVTGMVYR